MQKSTWFIKLVAFVSGLVVLGVEITAFRIVAPFFGNSIFITSNILAVILAGLAVGYWSGGWIADKVKAARSLYLLMLLTSCVCAIIPFVAPPLLGLLRDHVSTIDWRLIVFSLLGCIALFFIPFVLLGMVSPWLVHLGTDQHEHRGRAAGRIYAWSTLGSLLGTFLPTLVLVPLIGTKRTILLFAILLALIALIGLGQARWLGVVAVFVVAAFTISPSYRDGSPDTLAERESSVEYLRVVQDNGRAVHLEQDEGFGIHSIYDPARLTTGLFFEWFAFAPELRSAEARSRSDLHVGIIGLAGGTIARQIETWFGPESEVAAYDLTIKGAELDPATVQLAREYFALDELKTVEPIAADGRVWLAAQKEPLDVLLIDAFRQLYVPPHMTTKEFFQLASSKVAEDGIVGVNLNVLGRDTLIERTISATIASVFPYVQTVAIDGSYNVLFFASRSPLPSLDQPLTTAVPELRSVAERYTRDAKDVEASSARIATDDRPLVESLYDFMIGRAFLAE